MKMTCLSGRINSPRPRLELGVLQSQVRDEHREAGAKVLSDERWLMSRSSVGPNILILG
jgi:hypothetical protein